MTLSPPKTPVITPSRLGRYLEKKLADDRKLHLVGVQGEVSNLRPVTNGNLYFSLKDREAVLSCVAFAERAATFPAFENGADVIAYGEVKIYPRNSAYQLVVTGLELGGIGLLHARYEELSRKLQREGLFDVARKRRLPRYPFRVALVGSPTGDGTRDFRTQAAQRAPHVAIRLVPTAVNGPQAAPEIARAIARADALDVDLIVVIRGGGSYEDLFGFSDERVVRAIAACRLPTVAAIGHERDVPLIELAADVRAATPSTAAQTVLPRRDDLLRDVAAHAAALRRNFAIQLDRLRARLERVERRSPVADAGRLLESRRQAVDGTRIALDRLFERRIARRWADLLPLERRLTRLSPQARLERRRGRVGQLAAALEGSRGRILEGRRNRLAPLPARLDRAFGRTVERQRARLATVRAQFEGNDPETLLQRGYAIVTVGDRVLRDPADAPPGTRIAAVLARGTLHAHVEREAVDGGEQITLF
jgi:exodeoxyribonuclease VII large subunit